MKLLSFLQARRGAAAEVARASNLSRPYIWQCAGGARVLPADRCPAIELACPTITVEQLRPDVRWYRVPDPDWPHPDGRPCIDVAAPQAEVTRDAIGAPSEQQEAA